MVSSEKFKSTSTETIEVVEFNESKEKNINREKLLVLNPDLLFWVYNLKNNKENKLDLELYNNVLTCYPNQVKNLKWLDDFTWITIVNLSDLRKWKISILNWPDDVKLEKPVLLSNWAIELMEKYDDNWNKNLYIISTLRDWWAVDKERRTTIAWRNSSNNLNEDLEREYAEESPFLWLDKDWNYSLAIYNTSYKSIKFLKESIKSFLEKKYLAIPKKEKFQTQEEFEKAEEEYNYVKLIFEKSFPWIEYEKLWDILNEIIENNRFFVYYSEELKDIKWTEKDYKEISLWDSKWRFFVFFDEKNNTIEYRKIKKITWFKDWFKPLSDSSPWRLYLESKNQYPQFSKIWDLSFSFVPTVDFFNNKVSAAIKEIKKKFYIILDTKKTIK